MPGNDGLIAVIGGTGACRWPSLAVTGQVAGVTPFGETSSPVLAGEVDGAPVLFLPRHGGDHRIPPHAINYRANLWALREAGATTIVALNAVGAITSRLAPADLALPDQVLDYTWGRAHTFFDGDDGEVHHVDFTVPYDAVLRGRISAAAEALGLRCLSPCCYACTQGPRLESAAEIDRLERDGADLVGMTGMPEAALARELALPYASLCVVANMAAGRGDGEITMAEIEASLVDGVAAALELVAAVLRQPA